MDEIAFFRIVRLVSWKRLWNFSKMVCAIALSGLFKKHVLLGYPFALKVEPTNLCNLHCLQCATGQDKLTRPRGNMKLEDFKRLIDETADYVFHLFLYFQGEPFLHRDLFEFIRYAKEKKIYVIVSTNGHFFGDQRIVEETIASGLDSLIISLDGATAETYRKYRIGGNFDLVMDGIQQVIVAKNAASSRTPLVCLQFITMKHNEHEVDQVKTMARSLGVDRLLIKSMQVYYPETQSELLPSEDRFTRYNVNGRKLSVKGRKRSICKNLWTNTVITWDGTVAPCCFDPDAHYVLGKVFGDQSFEEVWFSDRYKEFRTQVLSDPNAIPMCTSCVLNSYIRVNNL